MNKKPYSKQDSLKTKTIQMVVIFFLLSSVITLLVNILQLKSSIQNAVKRESKAIGFSIKKTLENNLQYFNLYQLSGMRNYLKEIVKNNEIISYCFVSDNERTIIFHNDPEKNIGKKLEKDSYPSKLEFKKPHIFIFLGIYYESILPLYSKNKEYIGNIHLGVHKKVINREIEIMILKSALIFIITLILTIFLFFYFITKKIISPITSLSNEMRLVTEKMDFIKEIQVTGENEIAQLGKSFNIMLNKIRDYSEDLERAIAEVKKYNEINNKINSTLNFKEVLDIVIDYLNQLYDIEGYALLLLDQDKELLRVYRYYNPVLKDEISRQMINLEIPLNSKDAGLVESFLKKRFCILRE